MQYGSLRLRKALLLFQKAKIELIGCIELIGFALISVLPAQKTLFYLNLTWLKA